jgi:lysozyme family protein
MSYTFEQLEKGYTNLLEQMKLRSDWLPVLDRDATKIIRGKNTYARITVKTGVPWEVIGLIHLLESGCDFDTHLHNGDSLNHRTINVPKGRPKAGLPPFTFEESAIDALIFDGLVGIEDWSDARIAYQLERYNGVGYFKYNINSPYLWSGTTNYVRGKFVSDSIFDRDAVSKQSGAMAVLSRIRALDVAPKEIVAASRKLSTLKKIKDSVLATAGTYLTLDNLQLIPEWLHKVQSYSLDHSGAVLLGGAVVFWIVLQINENMAIQDVKDGRYIPSKLVAKKEDVELATFEQVEKEYKYTPGAYKNESTVSEVVVSELVAPVTNEPKTMASFIPEITSGEKQ